MRAIRLATALTLLAVSCLPARAEPGAVPAPLADPAAPSARPADPAVGLTGPAWVRARVEAMLAAPVTLEEAVRQHWYQVSPAELAAHGVSSRVEAGGDGLRRLAEHARSARPELLRQLDARFAGLTGLDGFGTPPSYCGWLIERQRPHAVIDVQRELRVHCTRVAAEAVERMLVQRAASLAVDLATLRSLDVRFPQAVFGDLPTASRPSLMQAWNQAVRDRLQAARGPVLAEIAGHFRAKSESTPSVPPRAECTALVGPETRGEGPLSTEARQACLVEAASWLRAQQPGIVRDIAAAVAVPTPATAPIPSVRARCTVAIQRWYPTPTDYAAVTGPVWQACEAAAEAALERDVAARVAPMVDRALAAPRTLAGLAATDWFELPAAVVADAADHPAPFASTGDVPRRLRARFDQAVLAARQEAIGQATAQVSQAYAASPDGPGPALVPARALCGPYLGDPVASGEARLMVELTCRAEEAGVPARGCATALRRFGDDNPLLRERLWVAAPDGRRVPFEIATLVCAAGMEGLQITTRAAGWLWGGHALRVAPLGREVPTMAGTLEQVRRADGAAVWHLDGLVGWPSLDGPLATVACLTAAAGAPTATGPSRVLLGRQPPHLDAGFEGGDHRLVAIGQHAAPTGCAAAKAAFLRQGDGR